MGLHGWFPLLMFSFFFSFRVTRPSSLWNRWHNSVDADLDLRLGWRLRKSELPSISPFHKHTHREILYIWGLHQQELAIYLVYLFCIYLALFTVGAAWLAGSLCLEVGPAQRKCLGSALCQLQTLVSITCGCHDDERAAGARWSVYDRKALLHVTNQVQSW